MARFTSLLILISLVCAVCAPLAIVASPATAETTIMTLDVCSRNHAAVSVNADSPVIEEHAFLPSPAGYFGILCHYATAVVPSSSSAPDERPPEH